MRSLRDLFLLDPQVVFLNHGSFGACPRPVFEVYQAWQRRLEAQPVHFMTMELPDLLQQARQRLGATLNVAGNDLVFVPNATFGVNLIARSLELAPVSGCPLNTCTILRMVSQRASGNPAYPLPKHPRGWS